MELEWTSNFFETVWTGIPLFRTSKTACRLNSYLSDLRFIIIPPQILLTWCLL